MTAYLVRAIGPADMAAGFALAGLPVDEARDAVDGVARLSRALARDDVGVLLVDEAIVAAMPDELRRRALRRSIPVVVPVPRPRWERRADEDASDIIQLLQRAIGYRMRLR